MLYTASLSKPTDNSRTSNIRVRKVRNSLTNPIRRIHNKAAHSARTSLISKAHSRLLRRSRPLGHSRRKTTEGSRKCPRKSRRDCSLFCY